MILLLQIVIELTPVFSLVQYLKQLLHLFFTLCRQCYRYLYYPTQSVVIQGLLFVHVDEIEHDGYEQVNSFETGFGVAELTFAFHEEFDNKYFADEVADPVKVIPLIT